MISARWLLAAGCAAPQPAEQLFRGDIHPDATRLTHAVTIGGVQMD